jgi:hypothetical protein
MSFGPLEDTHALRERYLRLTGEVLPAEATTEWPVREDHCFRRIVLDTLYDDVWYDHVAGRPAVDHLSADELRRAIRIAESMTGSPERVRQLNDASLRRRRDRD